MTSISKKTLLYILLSIILNLLAYQMMNIKESISGRKKKKKNKEMKDRDASHHDQNLIASHH